MKSDNKYLREYIRSLVKTYILEAEEEKEEKPAKKEEPADDTKEENPFAGSDDKGEEEGEEDKQAKKAETPAGIPISFNISKVKQYNKANFLSDKGIVKSIDKKGIVVTTQPDGVDVLVNFTDISENAKRFFKKKK